MGKKDRKKPKQQRPKGPGAKQRPAKRSKSASVESSAVESAPAPRRSGRERKSAPLATDLVAPAAQRCGRDGCPVCGSNLESMQNKPCPAFAEPPRDDGVDPRKLDEDGPHFKASDDIIAVMDALANSTKLEPPVRHALACFKDSLKKSGRLDARWASLAKIKARDDYDVDDINADDGAQKAIEAAVRGVHFKGGSKPSVEEMSKMGPLEMRTVVRVLSYIASIKKRTRAQSRARTAAMRQSQSDEARDTFLAFVEGRKYDGVHVCTTLARGEKSWPAYWEWCQTFLAKTYDACTLPQGEARFYRLLKRVRSGAPAWACAPEMRKWFQDRQCRYQRMMVSTTCHW